MNDAGQATPDELAAVYLRERDVPCRGCGYNRRDGLTAACPEYGKPLELPTECAKPGLTLRQSHTRIMAWLMMFGVASALLSYYASTFTMWNALATSGGGWSPFGILLATYAWGTAAMSVALYFTAKLIFRLTVRHSEPADNGRLLMTIVLWALAGFMPEMLYDFIVYGQAALAWL